MPRLRKSFLISSFLVYLIIFIFIVFLKYNNKAVFEYLAFLKDQSILYRFKDQFYAYEFTYKTFIDLSLNVIIFIPMGYYLYLIKPKLSFKKVFLISFVLTLSIETLQLFTCLGGMQYMDLITNILGLLIGFYFFKALKKDFKFYNYFNLITAIIFLPLMIYAIYNTINNLSLYNFLFK